MRSWIVVLAAACGPSAAEIKTAQTATYHATAEQLLTIAEEVAQENYKVGDVSRDGFATVPRWFGPEGDVENAGAGDYVLLRDRSVRITLHVKVVELDDHRVAVTVTPETVQYMRGSPQPRPLGPDDPYLPPFVKGRAEALTMAIYERAKDLAAK